MKLTNEGLAVIEGDNYLSAEIIAEGRLDVASAHALLDRLRQHIPIGGVAVDVGASLGDTAAVLSEMVGPSGRVFAFEPNPITFEALQHNMEHYLNVMMLPIGINDQQGCAHVIIDHNNIGASRLTIVPTEPVDIYNVETESLDRVATMLLTRRLDFLKIDAEGWEPLVLDGAVETIRKFRPAMLIEVNTWPLGKMGFTPQDIWSRLDALGYQYEPFDGPYGDVLALPKEKSC